MIGWSYNEESLLSTRLPHHVFEPLGLVDTRNLSVVSYQIPHSQGPQDSARENKARGRCVTTQGSLGGLWGLNKT